MFRILPLCDYKYLIIKVYSCATSKHVPTLASLWTSAHLTSLITTTSVRYHVRSLTKCRHTVRHVLVYLWLKVALYLNIRFGIHESMRYSNRPTYFTFSWYVVAFPRRQCWTTQWMVTFLYICMIATGNVIVCWGWYSYRQSVLLIVCRCVRTSSLAHSHTSQQTLWYGSYMYALFPPQGRQQLHSRKEGVEVRSARVRPS